jgi:hypothetical protein
MPNDSLVVAPQGNIGQLNLGQTLGTVATIATSGTISFSPGQSVIRVTSAGAITAVVLQAGAVPGQIVIVVNEGAYSMTPAVAATSNIANGVTAVINTLTAMAFVWDSVTALWYDLKGA